MKYVCNAYNFTKLGLVLSICAQHVIGGAYVRAGTNPGIDARGS
ncbi:hypothetical protein MTBLM5_10005 [Magnetospirillum sp. LM-5]|nr:hypothetical protein MTBLM5_10005 [Magnetospirillum sp. LM-5]